jgi:long-chain acyl-CoA synthetase
MLIDHLVAQAARQPEEIAIFDESCTLAYARLAGAAAIMAQKLGELSQKQNIGLLLPSSAGFVASFYGTLWAGKCVTPINFLLGPAEIAHVVADSGIDTVVTVTPLAEKIAGLGLKVVDLMTLPPPAEALPSATSVPALPPIPKKSADDMAVLMYTSGTAGMPKGVELTYGNLQSDVDAAIEHAALKHGHVFLGLIPLFHAFGMTGTMLAPIQLGARVVYMTRFSGAGAVKAIREHKVSLVQAVPSMYGAMLHMKGATAEDFSSIYALISGGEPLPAALTAAFAERFGQRIYEGYGLTETCAVACLNVPHAWRAGTVGRLIPSARVRIVGEDGTDQPTGQSGEVWLGGPMIMKGYHNLPTQTAAALTSDGFFKTGDLGTLDADGYLRIVGRIKELIIVAGEKAVPREIEEGLLKHPAVAEAAVVGKKDPGRGEVVVAYVVFKAGQSASADELRRTCREAGLPQWKIPKEIFFETDLPRSPTGKVLKRALWQRVNSA